MICAGWLEAAGFFGSVRGEAVVALHRCHHPGSEGAGCLSTIGGGPPGSCSRVIGGFRGGISLTEDGIAIIHVHGPEGGDSEDIWREVMIHSPADIDSPAPTAGKASRE